MPASDSVQVEISVIRQPAHCQRTKEIGLQPDDHPEGTAVEKRREPSTLFHKLGVAFRALVGQASCVSLAGPAFRDCPKIQRAPKIVARIGVDMFEKSSPQPSPRRRGSLPGAENSPLASGERNR